MSKQAFIDALFTKRATYSDPDQAEMTANLLDTVSSDIYSESQRFVFELIQNADDAARGDENEVRFDFFDHHLLVSHNGSAFTPEDIEAITGAGFSRKKNDPAKTGYKGIGFKSVFGKSNWVGIFSDGYHLRFEKDFHKTRVPWQVIPIWTEASTLPDKVRRFIEDSGYHVTTVIHLPAAPALEQELGELLHTGQILLFLRHVNTITVARHGQVQYTISKTVAPATTAYQPTTLWKDRKATSNWLVQRFDNLPVDADTQKVLQGDEKTPAKLRDASHTELAFAARVDSGRIRALTAEESLLFTYLPTKVADFSFPFLVNGSFLTSAAREALHEDRVWNQWLLGLVAENLFAWLAQLAQTDHRFEVLQLLPTLFSNSSNELKKAFNEKAKQAITTCAFVPTQSQTLARVSEVVIDDTGLASQAFISKEALVEFVNAKSGSNFLPSSFAHSDLQLSRKLPNLGATLFEASNLEEFFLSDVFSTSHQLDQNYALLEYFFRKATKYDNTGEWNYKLKLIPFIYSSDQELKAPATICFPSLAYKTDSGQTVTVIHSTIYAKINQNADLKSWLESLGVKEPSDEAYLENEILGNIEKYITKDNYQQITRYLLSQFKKGKLTPTHLEKLQDLPLLCSNGKLIAAKEAYLADVYEPALKLELINKVVEYVSPDYKQPQDLTSEWKTFFLKIGVSENISMVYVACKKAETKGIIEAEYFDLVIKEGKSTNGYPSWISELNAVHLQKIRSSHYAHKYDFSKLFWEQTFKTVDLSKVKPNALIPWGMYGSMQSVTNYFYWYLNNAAVFPTSQKICRKAAEVFLNHKDIIEVAGAHLPVFDYDEPIPEGWKPLLKFRQQLEVEDYLKILTSIVKTSVERNGALSDAERGRIGLVYNQLAKRMSHFSSTEKAALFTWSGSNRLLAANGSFEPAAELKWITEEGFNSVSGSSLKALYIPKNCQTDTPEFAQLLELLQIQCIREFTPQIEDPSPNPTLKNKLFRILPYLALIIHKRQYKSAEGEFNRMHKMVEATAFYSASAICLSFTDRGETISGQPLPIYRGADHSFYLKGDWRSPRTAYNLLRELSALLEVKKTDNELRLLLELPSAEIEQWLLEDVAVAPTDLAAARNWLPKLLNPESAPVVQTAESPTSAAPTISLDTNGFEESPGHSEWGDDSFEPNVSANEIDPASISVSNRTLTAATIAQQGSYGTISNPEARLNIGRWCEELVYKMLCAASTEYTSVQWMNQHTESSLPYDFKVVQNGQERFLEVKGTPSRLKDSIYLSPAEWRVMFDQGANYSIYRVLGAGNFDPKVIVTDHPSSQVEKGQLLPALIEMVI